VPPLCLLLGAQVAAATKAEWLRRKLRPWLTASLVFACLFTSGYAAWKIGSRYHTGADALVRFSREARRMAEEHHWRYEVVGGREEGMLLYLRRDHFLAPNDALEQWNAGQVDALIVRNEPARPWPAVLPDSRPLLVSEQSTVLPQYSLLVHARTASP